MVKKSKAQLYLERIEGLNDDIENKLAEIRQWNDIALCITTNAEGERVQSSGNPQKMANAMDKVVDCKREANEMIDALIDYKQEVINTIKLLNATESNVLHKRYIQGMTYDEIGASKRKTKSWATTVHGRALQNLNKILEAREQKAANM